LTVRKDEERMRYSMPYAPRRLAAAAVALFGTVNVRRLLRCLTACAIAVAAMIAISQSSAQAAPHLGAARNAAVTPKNVGNDPRCAYKGRFSPIAAQNKFLSVAGGGGSGTRVLLWTATGGSEQVWCEEPRGAASVLHPSYNLNLCLDVPAGHYQRGVKVQVWSCNGRQNQYFNRQYPLFRSGVISWLANDFPIAVVNPQWGSEGGVHRRCCRGSWPRER
jgi:hypothetical protein